MSRHNTKHVQRGEFNPARSGVGLARALSKMGLASRTVAASLIETGRVSVNGQVLRNPEARIDMARDRIALDNVLLSEAPKRYIAVNKPRGLVTTASDEQGRTTVYACLSEDDQRAWLVPVGRLDKASEGLIFFTNDTAWAQRILDPTSHLPKTYHVQVSRLLSEDDVAQLQHGVVLDGGMFARAEQVRILRSGQKNCWLEIVLHQGLNRQIRRMLTALGSVDPAHPCPAEVLRLIRVAIGPVVLGALPKGQSRPLTDDELTQMSRNIAL